MREKRIEKTETRNALALQYETDERRRLGICGALPSLWTAALEASCAAPTECERTPHSCVPRVPSEKKKREREGGAHCSSQNARGELLQGIFAYVSRLCKPIVCISCKPLKTAKSRKHRRFNIFADFRYRLCNICKNRNRRYLQRRKMASQNCSGK